jgi:superfamily I DNA/RNA helicase
MRRLVNVEFTEEQLHRSAFWKEELPALALERLLDGPGAAANAGAGAASGAAGSGALRRLVPGGGEAFDELILDEGQDMLRESYLDVLDLSFAGGFAEGRYRIFGDFAHQAIFDAADLTFEDLQARCPTAFIADLAVNCRNTPRVLALARGVDAEESGRIARPDDGVEPVVRFYRDAEHQCDLLGEALDQLRDEGFTGPQVVVLSPHNDQACAAAGFCGMGAAAGGGASARGGDEDAPSADDPAPADRRAWRDRLAPLVPTGQHEPDLRSGKTKYASIYRFKGLESRAVVLTDIDRLETAHERDLFYIGATRATQRLIVLAHDRLRALHTLRAR